MAGLKSIPQELMLEIFSWLPIKSLLRYRCVSKFYNSLVLESNFIDIHHRRSMIRPGGRKYLMHKEGGIFYTSEDGKESSLVRIENFAEFGDFFYDMDITCVNGMVCSWKDKHHIVVWNFNTRQVRHVRLPKKYNRFPSVFSIGFEPQRKEYKLWLSPISSSLKRYRTNWVFTLGVDKSWRKIKWKSTCYRYPKSVCVNGVIYMFNPWEIIAFDVKYETCRILKLPVQYDSILTAEYRRRFDSTEMQFLTRSFGCNPIQVMGKLGMLVYNTDSSKDMNLWIMGKEDYYWETDPIIISFPSQWMIDDDIEQPYDFHFIWTPCDDRIVFQNLIKSIHPIYMCYHVTTKTWTQFEGIEEHGTTYGCFDDIFSYVENLISL